MISPKVLGKHVEKFIVDNAPTILTGVGVAGSVATAYLTGRSTIQAIGILENETDRRFREDPKFDRDSELSKTETFKLVWMLYLPPAAVLSTTVTAIVFANRISTKRVAAMAVAYSLSEKRMSEYREKVMEKFNPNKERQIQDEIAQDRVTNAPPKEGQIIITGNGDVLCYDMPSDRYFRSNMERLRSVQNDINGHVVEVGSATLSDFYVALGLKETPFSEEIGWMTDKMMDIHFSAVLTDENQPCIAINYHCSPIRQGTGAGFPKGCDADPEF